MQEPFPIGLFGDFQIGLDNATETLSRLRDAEVAHVTVRPKTSGVPFMGFSDYRHLVEAGWRAMEDAWPTIQEALSDDSSSRGNKR
ncbi:hypothetical protein [Sulfobacillus harzensis]|uniref:hypothetical protein n=1 Tax=Sulfobacillus harzensis TaxID=2729629 RepID=UPI00145F88CB|nr:hypothetical protein [Sulfobacillus harzensis]